MTRTFTACKNDEGRRLDRVLRRALSETPLSAVHRMLRTGGVLINGERAQPSSRLRCGDVIKVEEGGTPPALHSPRAKAICAAVCSATPLQGALPLEPRILLETEDILLVNKPSGIVTHGENSLETLVSAYLAANIPPSLSFRPGPLHRLDRETSGIIAFSKSLRGAQWFSRALREGQIRKTYHALLCGVLRTEEYWEDELVRDSRRRATRAASGGKRALSRVIPLEPRGAATLAAIEIFTGRTHQIRAQAAAHGRPLAGDIKYGGGANGGRGFYLHAYKLEFPQQNPLHLPVRVIAKDRFAL